MLLAISGGADSLALLIATAERASVLGLELVVGTIDHGLRPEAKEETRGVLELARALGLSASHVALELGGGAGLEQRARVAREAALARLMKEHGCQAIATAHTATDQAETVLMRLSRGAALRGASGVLPRKGVFVRPLLAVTRAEVIAFLQARGRRWVEDPMNADSAFFRARVRHGVLPALEKAAGREVERPLAAFARNAAEDEAFLQSLAIAASARCARDGGLELSSLAALEGPILRRVLAGHLEAEGARVDTLHLERALELVRHGGRLSLASTRKEDRSSMRRELVAVGGLLRVVATSVETSDAPTSVASRGSERESRVAGAITPASEALLIEGSTETPVVHAASGWRFWLTPPSAGSPAATLRCSISSLPIRIRSRARGERIRLTSGHSRRIQDVLVDARVPRERRERVPIVEVAGEAVWIVGVTRPLAEEQPYMLLHALKPEETSGGHGDGL